MDPPGPKTSDQSKQIIGTGPQNEDGKLARKFACLALQVNFLKQVQSANLLLGTRLRRIGNADFEICERLPLKMREQSLKFQAENFGEKWGGAAFPNLCSHFLNLSFRGEKHKFENSR